MTLASLALHFIVVLTRMPCDFCFDFFVCCLFGLAHCSLLFFHFQQWHPDKNPDNPEATKHFQKISEAYAILSDPKKRDLYNRYGAEGANMADQMPEGATAGGFPGGPGMHFGPGGSASHHMSPEEANAFFAHFFGDNDPFGGFGMGGGRPSFSSRGGRGLDPMAQLFMGGGGMPGGIHMGGGMPGGMFGSIPGGVPMGGMGSGGPSMMRQSATRAKRYDAIPNGTMVSFKGLVNRPDRNGDRGEIQDYDPASGRYVVLVEDTDEVLRVKPSNLLQHVHVTVIGVESQRELNHSQGTILAWNETKQRYNIYLSNLSRVVSLKPQNVLLKNGTVGMIVGLVAKPYLNGKYGTVKSYVKESNRYEVQISADQVLRIKVENIRV